MITKDQAEQLRGDLLRLLAEDAHNSERLLSRLDGLSRERGVGAHAALLLILTHLGFDESEARRHWGRILEHQKRLSRGLGRDAGIRVAVLDYFVNVNKQLVQPTLIDLELLEADAPDATRDARTGLATDRYFRSALQQELRRARRYDQQTTVALFDLDDFAEVNARCGELVADRLLREAALVLSNNIRDIDLGARPGEDEFALLLPETGRNGALQVTERFRTELQQFFSKRECADGTVDLTVSCGIACFPEDARAPDALLSRAAQALYHAKASGKNTVRLFHPERRRYLRFELEPGKFEVEVLAPSERREARLRNLSRNGILFLSPESLEIGDEIEIRLADAKPTAAQRPLRIRGSVVRLEQLPEPVPVVGLPPDAPEAFDRFEIGVAFDLAWGDGVDDLIDFLERAQRRSVDAGS